MKSTTLTGDHKIATRSFLLSASVSYRLVGDQILVSIESQDLKNEFRTPAIWPAFEFVARYFEEGELTVERLRNIFWRYADNIGYLQRLILDGKLGSDAMSLALNFLEEYSAKFAIDFLEVVGGQKPDILESTIVKIKEDPDYVHYWKRFEVLAPHASVTSVERNKRSASRRT